MADKNTYENLQAYRPETDWLYGLKDDKDNVILPPTYETIAEFSDGLARVEKDDKYGFIDKNGKVVTPVEWDHAESFRDGYAFVMKNGEEFLIDKTGKIWEAPAK